jgi:hypothetical protein
MTKKPGLLDVVSGVADTHAALWYPFNISIKLANDCFGCAAVAPAQ